MRLKTDALPGVDNGMLHQPLSAGGTMRKSRKLKSMSGKLVAFIREAKMSFVSKLIATKENYPPGDIRKFWACNVRRDARGNLLVSLRWHEAGAYLDKEAGKEKLYTMS